MAARCEAAVILAAGWGSRIQSLSVDGAPISKPLIPLKGQPMIARVIRTLAKAGIRRVVVVTGYLRERVETLVHMLGPQLKIKVDTIYNPRWDDLANGVSALAAEPLVEEPFLLSMSDHAFDLGIVASLVAEGPRDMAVRLCIDRKIDQVFDLDDATKVKTEGERIVAIGKNLTDYNAVDIGLFSCLPEIFGTLSAAFAEKGDCSLSDGMRRLGEAGRFGYFDVGAALWQDADTVETLRHAEMMLDKGLIRFPD
ncbi:MAG: nucleotidyltransferase [Myxococcales bacterium]|nr:MAG: nucleotidyltransferase [Myxococcales bacterium]